MAQDDLFGAPAGWYPDPLGLPQLRWWNNHAWTEQTAAARQPMVAQDTKFAWADDEPVAEQQSSGAGFVPGTDPASDDTLRQLEPPFAEGGSPEPPNPYAESAKWWETRGTDTRRAASAASAATAPAEPVANPFMQPVAPEPRQPDYRTPERPEGSASFAALFDGSATAAPASTFAASADSLEALFGTPTAARNRARTPIVSSELFESSSSAPSRLNASTSFVWPIALLPVAQLMVQLVLLTAIGMGINPVLFNGIAVIAYLVGVLLAYFDRRALVAGGFERPPHWAFAALTVFVYLVLRARATLRESGHGIGPLVTYLGLAVLQLASVVVVPGLLIAALPSVFASQIEQSVETDAALLAGATMTVDCPDTPPLFAGDEITCVSTSDDSTSTDIIVTLTRANGWIGWQVLDWGKYTLSN
ncbi:MAG: DUF2510 domain-containing protein [Microbacteriaceae bacterium]